MSVGQDPAHMLQRFQRSHSGGTRTVECCNGRGSGFGPDTVQQHGFAFSAEAFDGGGSLLQDIAGVGVGFRGGGIHQPERRLVLRDDAGNVIRSQPAQTDHCINAHLRRPAERTYPAKPDAVIVGMLNQDVGSGPRAVIKMRGTRPRVRPVPVAGGEFDAEGHQVTRPQARPAVQVPAPFEGHGGETIGGSHQ